MSKSDELLIEFRATRTVLKEASDKYAQLKRNICKAYGKEYDSFMSDADIMEMLLSGEPKEGA